MGLLVSHKKSRNHTIIPKPIFFLSQCCLSSIRSFSAVGMVSKAQKQVEQGRFISALKLVDLLSSEVIPQFTEFSFGQQLGELSLEAKVHCVERCDGHFLCPWDEFLPSCS